MNLNKFNSWVDPKTKETRVYLNCGTGLKVWANETAGDSIHVNARYDYPDTVPHKYRNSGRCWGINYFIDEMIGVEIQTDWFEPKWTDLFGQI